VAVRNVRRDARKDLEALEKQGEISRDELDRTEKDLEKAVHEVIAEIDEMVTHKERELLEV
jgi:ribosome recycling factor